MKFAAGEGQHPLEDLDWSEHYSFPLERIQVGYLTIYAGVNIYKLMLSFGSLE